MAVRAAIQRPARQAALAAFLGAVAVAVAVARPPEGMEESAATVWWLL